MAVGANLIYSQNNGSGIKGQVEQLSSPQVMEGFGKVPLMLKQHIVLPELSLLVGNQAVTLKNISAWVDPTDKAVGLTLGRPVMKALGYSTEALLQDAAMNQDSFDLRELSVLDQEQSAVCCALKARYAQFLAEGGDLDDIEVFDDEPPVSMTVSECLQAKVDEAIQKGLSAAGATRLAAILVTFEDVFRIKLQKDRPISVEPLQVRFKEGAVPTTCKARRYSPLQTEFLRQHLAEIVDTELGRRTNRSRWSSPPRIVPKKDGTFRMTVDTQGPNSQTEPMLWPMPVLEVVMARLAGKTYFFILDWFKGFWQLPLHYLSREAYTIMGVNEMVESNRVLMGQSDVVAFCQSAAQEVYGERYGNGIEARLDDALGSGSSESELLDLLEWLLGRCALYGLKLNPSKCAFFATEVVWCGKKISSKGISHDPKRLEGLIDLQTPTNTQDLQQFVCALN